ncbi:MAG TPA: helix-turn-helix domain-containing protein [Polyangiaceae bacterium]
MYTLGRPAAALAPFIEHYWFVVTPKGESMNLSVDVFADARADLVFNMGAAYTRVAPPRAAIVRRSNLDAQRVYPITIRQRGEVIVAGARFRTAGLGAFVSSVHRWTGRVVPIATAFGKGILALEGTLRAAIGDAAKQGALLDEFFLSRLDVTESKRTLWALKSKIEAAEGLVRIDDLAAEAGISIRQVDRLFRQHLGIGPKTFARIARFQNAINFLKGDPGCTLAALAARCGYYDQAHFVHDCRRFAGASPKEKRGYYPADAPSDFSPNLVQFLQDSRRK